MQEATGGAVAERLTTDADNGRPSELEPLYAESKRATKVACARFLNLACGDGSPAEVAKAATELRQAADLLAGYAHQLGVVVVVSLLT